MSAIPIPAKPFEDSELIKDTTSKRDIITFITEHASKEFLKQNKMGGKVTNILKLVTKEKAIEVYMELFKSESFKDPNQVEAEEKVEVLKDEENADKKEVEVKGKEKVLYSKLLVKKGDKMNYPKKGDTVYCWYTGKLENGQVFDSNQGENGVKKPKHPLSFKVGVGRVIRGWDEALLTMSIGEKCTLTIESEWGYGKKGMPQAKIPPNAKLIFDVELTNISY